MTVERAIRSLAPPLLAALLGLFVFAGHFSGDFHQGDAQSVEANAFIQSLAHTPCFFFDNVAPCHVRAASTWSSLPANAAYRPLVLASFAVDYAIGGRLAPFWFHVDQFLVLLGLVVLLASFLRTAYRHFNADAHALWLAWLAAGWFLVHPATAETVSSLSARPGLYAAFFVMAALVAYQSSGWLRHRHAYVLFVILGMLCHPTAALFVPLWVAYRLFVESRSPLAEWSRDELRGFARSLAPAAAAAAGMWLLIWYMERGFPTADAVDYAPYLWSQPFAYVHYLTQWFLPFRLGADAYFLPFAFAWDTSAIIGYIAVAILLGTVARGFLRRTGRVAAFGAAWFVIAMQPWTWVASASVLDDRRMFLAMMGVAAVVVWGLFRGWQRLGAAQRGAMGTAVAVLLCAYAVGARTRAAVWSTEVTHWKDLAEKSPTSADAHRSYGLALLNHGDALGAEAPLRRAVDLEPFESYAQVNLAVALEQLGRLDEADAWFSSAIQLAPGLPDMRYFYGRFLANSGRHEEAISRLFEASRLPGTSSYVDDLLMDLLFQSHRADELRAVALQILQVRPGDERATWYLDHPRQELPPPAPPTPVTPPPALAPTAAVGSPADIPAPIEMAAPAELPAVQAVQAEAVPGEEPTVEVQVEAEIEAEAAPASAPHEDLVNFGLLAYREGRWTDALTAFANATMEKPDYAAAWNNLCATHNELQQWTQAVSACEKALEIDPTFELARGNLEWARSSLAEKSE